MTNGLENDSVVFTDSFFVSCPAAVHPVAVLAVGVPPISRPSRRGFAWRGFVVVTPVNIFSTQKDNSLSKNFAESKKAVRAVSSRACACIATENECEVFSYSFVSSHACACIATRLKIAFVIFDRSGFMSRVSTRSKLSGFIIGAVAVSEWVFWITFYFALIKASFLL